MMNSMTPAGELLRAEIERDGPLSLERFMEVALYHPQHGYYRRAKDPFGRSGDFFTASQLQPAFGLLIRAVLENYAPPRHLRDVGAGRGEMSGAFSPPWTYEAVDHGDAWRDPFEGVLFANELFDALPCRAYDAHGQESRVNFDGARFVWTTEPIREECPRLPAMMDQLAQALTRGLLLVIDYGYLAPQYRQRFPQGSLMSYRSHQADADILALPGEQDITAHVNFTQLIHCAQQHGLRLRTHTLLSSLLLQAGETVVAQLAGTHAGALKTLLFGMGESFDAVLLERL